MKQNTFYILVGIIGLILLVLFGVSILLSNPFIIIIGFVLGVCLYFYLGRQVTDGGSDERQQMIEMKTASATLKAFFVSFLTVNLPLVVYAFSAQLGLQRFTFTRSAPTEMGSGGPARRFEILNSTMNGTDPSTVAVIIHEGETTTADVVYNVTTHAIQIVPAPPEMISFSNLGIFGALQILILILMLFIYVGFRMYYSHQLGEWDDDEE